MFIYHTFFKTVSLNLHFLVLSLYRAIPIANSITIIINNTVTAIRTINKIHNKSTMYKLNIPIIIISGPPCTIQLLIIL